MQFKGIIPALCLWCGLSLVAAELTDAQWQDLKSQALARKREVLYNTDGCDAVYFPRNLAGTKENFLKQRLNYAIGTKVDTVSYCPLTSGFGYLTSRTQVGDQLLVDPPHAPEMRNVTGELLAQGTDPLKLAEEFCRANKLEFFVSLRCNDTHDMGHRKGAPYFLFPPYKEAHPEYLMGSFEKRPRHCQWSAVDFTHRAIRERFLAIIRELLTNYEVDGIELDFCRHLQYFKSVAEGKEASLAEQEMMNECMREIRKAAESIGRDRRRPILVAVRVPDSAEYARATGLDIETWLREKLVDIMIGGFYLRLNPWQYGVELSRRYGVKFYPSLDESRIYKTHPSFKRNTDESVNARITAALQAGADGIYYFNREKQHLAKFRGNLADMRFLNKRYFITYLYRDATTYLATGNEYDNLRNLSPLNPVMLRPGQAEEFLLEFGDDLSLPEVLEHEPGLTAYVNAQGVKPGDIGLQVNGQEATVIDAGNDVISYQIPLTAVRPGHNKVVLSGNAAASPKPFRQVILKGNVLLTGKNQPPWRRLFAHHDFKNSERIVNNAYRIADSGVMAGEKANLLYPLLYMPAANLDVSFQMRLESSSEPLSTVFRLADGKNVEIITFEPEQVGLYYGGKKKVFNTADRFHEYRAILADGRIILTADGKELFDEPLMMKTDNPESRLKNAESEIPLMHDRSLLLGSLSGPGTGAASWKEIRLYNDGSGFKMEDLKFELSFPNRAGQRKYALAQPVWQLDFNVLNGEVPSGRNIRNTYKAENLSITDRKTLRMEHRGGFEQIVITAPAILRNKKDILISEWKIRYLGDDGENSSFQVVIAPETPSGNIWFGNLTFYDAKIATPWGTIALDKPLTGRDVVLRLNIDPASGEAALFCDGRKLGEGRIRERAGLKPQIWFGDGSGKISGAAEIICFKATNME